MGLTCKSVVDPIPDWGFQWESCCWLLLPEMELVNQSWQKNLVMGPGREGKNEGL